MEVSGLTYLTPAMLHLMVAAAIRRSKAGKKSDRQGAPVATERDEKSQAELEASFLKGIDAHQGILIKISRAYGYKPDDEEDLFQEIIYQLWKAYPSFADKAQFSTWMHEIALRTAILPFRRGAAKIELRETLPDQVVDEVADRDDVEDRVFRMFRDLDINDKAILTLRIEGYGIKEIARMLKLREGAVKMRISRMKKVIDRH
jgi:RNA polymerase sigma-70 factor (ECF subfamily)